LQHLLGCGDGANAHHFRIDAGHSHGAHAGQRRDAQVARALRAHQDGGGGAIGER
jgi:hypothetical protein